MNSRTVLYAALMGAFGYLASFASAQQGPSEGLEYPETFQLVYYADQYSRISPGLIEIAFWVETNLDYNLVDLFAIDDGFQVLTQGTGADADSPFIPFWQGSLDQASIGANLTAAAFDDYVTFEPNYAQDAQDFYDAFVAHYYASVWLGNLYFDFGQGAEYTYYSWLYNYIAWIYCIEAAFAIDDDLALGLWP